MWKCIFVSIFRTKKTKCCNLAGPAVSLTSPEGKNVKCTAVFLLHTYWPISRIYIRVSTGRPGTKKKFLSRCPFVPGQGQEQMSRDVPGQNHFPKRTKKQEIWSFFEKFWYILSQDVPGEKSLSRDICSCPCPGTKGHRDKNFFFVPGQWDNGTSRPVDTLVPTIFKKLVKN